MFKGFRFVRAPKVIFLSPPPGSTNVVFLRICRPDEKGAVKTEWKLEGEPVFGKPIKIKGYSQTNMAYGYDGRVYLALDGRCYSTFVKSPAERGEAKLMRRLAREQAAREAAREVP